MYTTPPKNWKPKYDSNRYKPGGYAYNWTFIDIFIILILLFMFVRAILYYLN